MTDVIVRATALKWASDDFPGWLEVSIVDAARQEHRIIEKVPVLTTQEVTIFTLLPTELWIAADVEHVEGGRVGITFQDGIETLRGWKGLTLRTDDVRWP